MRVVLKDIHKHFGPVRANDGINLVFEPGNIYGVLGENGAGKSTLMKILSGFQKQDMGQILLDGKDTLFPSPLAALNAGIGMLYQDPLDFPPFNIVDNYLLGKEQKLFLSRKQAIEDLTNLATRYGFSIDVQARIDSLSIGERQQLELVRLLAGGAQVLILDEPTTGISGEQKEVLFASMRQLAKKEGKTLILVSHKLEEVQDLCDHAYVLQKGKMVGETEVPCPNERFVELMFDELPPRADRLQMMGDELALSLEEVSIRTYRLSVENINLSVKTGETIGFAGLEGSGQGLLLRAIAGLEKIDDGEMTLIGEQLNKVNLVQGLPYHENMDKGIAYMSSGRVEEGLVAGLSLTEHMVLAAPEKEFFIDWKTARIITEERIDRFQVIGTPESKADQLSGGNQQRLLFGMLNSPLKLILLDKPTRGLDVRSTDWIWKQLDSWRERGTAIIFISSDLDEIVDRSDRIAVFSGGKLLRVVNSGETNVDELGHLIGGQQ